LNKVCVLNALQQPIAANWNKWNKRPIAIVLNRDPALLIQVILEVPSASLRTGCDVP